ncbi:MAG: hypothetical protein HOC20_12640 [Chloroflexi bacterium]|jgi:predicted membrane chloride channel (bestrophin family)|nr:hypothetical protein [Chloroflexota bacterium]
MHIVKDFLRVISIQTFVVVAISCFATFLCLQYDVFIDLPTALIGIAIIFPIVFSINAAYRRREEALGHFASLKGHGVALYYAHRDWVPENNPEDAQRMKQLIDDLLRSIHSYFSAKNGDGELFQDVYQRFSDISESMEKLRTAGVSNSEISRCNQYMRAMMIDFERMRNIYLYRTPTTLRAYSHIFLNTFPILFAPYFANLADESYTVTGYLVAAFYGLVLVSLDNIQEDLESPYDQIGADDLNLNVADQYNRILNDKTK